jgi:hypothetical protein
MPSLIQQWQTPLDPGGGNPERQYRSPVVGANWSKLYAQFAYQAGWSGSFRIYPGENVSPWFNRYPQPVSPFIASDPNQAYITTATDQMEITVNNGGGGFSALVQLFGDPGTPGPYCAYGTRLQSTANFVYYLTPGLIDVWLAAAQMAWLAPLLTATWFTTLNAQSLCAQGPPVLAPIDTSTFDSGITTITNIVKAVAWPNLCECIPGTPAPTPFPPLPNQQPTGWPTAPTFG